MKSALLLVLLSSAAYAQVPRPPPPPPMTHTSPPLGAPTGPQVGPLPRGPQAAPALPPSPNKRVLPPSSAPGLWSADTKASTNKPAGMSAKVYRTQKDIRDLPDVEGLSNAALLSCWATTQQGMNDEARTQTLDGDEYECLRLKLLDQCGITMIKRAMRKDPHVAASEADRKQFDLLAFNRSLGGWMTRICGMPDLDLDAVNALFPGIFRRLSGQWSGIVLSQPN